MSELAKRAKRLAAAIVGKIIQDQDIYGSCLRKKKFATEKEASSFLGQRAYRCVFCDHWHRTKIQRH